MNNTTFKIPYSGKGSIYDDAELECIKKLLLDPQSTLSCGQETKNFEKEFAEFVGVSHAFSLTNCTIGLQFASYLLGLQKDDQVISTSFTYQATIQSLLTMPIEIKFCDIDENSLCVDIDSIKNLITSKTKAIYITHYGGLMPDMDVLISVARKHNIIVIEDCAHAIGSSYKNRLAGSTADIGCFSFHSMKNISTLGEGGMITFNNPEWAAIIDKIKNIEPHALFSKNDVQFGEFRKSKYSFEDHQKNAFTHDCRAIMHAGTNSTLSEVAAAVGRIQLRKVHQFNQKRKEIFTYLNQALAAIPEIRVQEIPKDIESSHHLYTFFLRPEYKINRDEFVGLLCSYGVEIVLRYFPIHLLPEWRFKGGYYGQCPVTENIWFKEIVNLPCYPTLNVNQLDYMIEAIKKAVNLCVKKRKVYCS